MNKKSDTINRNEIEIIYKMALKKKTEDITQTYSRIHNNDKMKKRKKVWHESQICKIGLCYGMATYTH